MPSPSVAILDPASDTNREELARLTKLYEFPAFVKKADLDATMNPSRVAVTTYADPVHKRFACHTAAATWLSGLYFQEKQAEYHPKDRARIQQRLDEFVDYFSIRGHYDTMCKHAADLHKESELPDSAYAYVWVSEKGAKDRYLPMRSGMEVKAAAEWLEQYQDRLPYHDRNTIAIKILEKAAAFGAMVSNNEFLEKQAGYGCCDPKEVVDMICQCAILCKSSVHRAEIEKLAHTVETQPKAALQPDQLVKLAVTLDMADKALNLHGQYGKILKRPEDVLFKVTFTKAASDVAELCALTTGNVYSKEQFEKLSKEDVESLFGTDFASEVSSGLDVDGEKMAELAHTLPRPDAELLDRLMADANLHPRMAKAASDGHGLTNKQIEELAAAYAPGA